MVKDKAKTSQELEPKTIFALLALAFSTFALPASVLFMPTPPIFLPFEG